MHFHVYAWRALLSIEDDAVEAILEETDWGVPGDRLMPFAVTQRSLWFATAREAIVPLLVELHAEEPPLPAQGWDMVVEATVESRSGRLSMTFPNDGLHMVVLSVGRGFHTIRASGWQMEAADPLDDEGPDRYSLQIWPAAETKEPAVIRLPNLLGPDGRPRYG